MDPWSKQPPITQISSTHTTSKAATTTRVLPEAAQSRPTEGPIQEMFQLQDTRILAIEPAMTQLQAAQQKQATDSDAKIQQLGQTLSQHMPVSTSNFEQLYSEQKSMSQSIATAMQRQDERLAQSMDELKSLFLQARGIKRPSDANTADMEDQE